MVPRVERRSGEQEMQPAGRCARQDLRAPVPSCCGWFVTLPREFVSWAASRSGEHLVDAAAGSDVRKPTPAGAGPGKGRRQEPALSATTAGVSKNPRDGITHVTATPHCHRHLRLFRDAIVPHVAQFNQALRAEGVALDVLPGSEIQLFDVALYRREYEAGLYCHLGDDAEFLVEGARFIFRPPDRSQFCHVWVRAVPSVGGGRPRGSGWLRRGRLLCVPGRPV